ncbi:alpha/beta fold hydrolase [Virgibacillus sp. 179-BFC.A HS]|uniref:Alpha/beta fold hydrolase n=1 Tax=Tigheibacillus jepli TaxID=3035914 RepID=A0ABU5CM30_9BACI|nr:alpha/beta fold hydrolase [Virgibacillus sp. 179-BFC.A HS]MDY0406961.1 alpha/beta fold hydrolase [Virgibacillus sp. 179-BFC.A HS]
MKRKWIVMFFAVLFLAAVAFLLDKDNSGTANTNGYKVPPTVFVHGYKGTYNSFGNMLDRFENNYRWGDKMLVYYITPNGRLEVDHMGYAEEQPSFVQIVLDNNRASFKNSAYWVSLALHHMKTHYQIDQVYMVGHSMGGIVSLKYIEDYRNPKNFPMVKKFIAIGSPFDGIYDKRYFEFHQDAATKDLKPSSKALTDLRKHKNTVPKDLEALSIASTGDHVARVNSVKSLGEIIPASNLEQKVITDENLGHSMLHEDKRVDFFVHDFLYGEN